MFSTKQDNIKNGKYIKSKVYIFDSEIGATANFSKTNQQFEVNISIRMRFGILGIKKWTICVLQDPVYFM